MDGLDIAHVVQRCFAVQEADVGNQGVGSLIGGHAVFAAVGNMLEAGILADIEGQQRVHYGLAVFHKAGIRVGVDPQSGAGHDYLGTAFRVDGTPGGIAAAVLLDRGQAADALLHRCLYSGLAPVVRQCLKHHGGDIRVCGGPAQRPAAVRKLFVQNIVDALLPDRGVAGFIAVGIQCDQREDRAVDALLAYACKIAEGLDNVPVAHLCGLLSDGRQGQNQAGVFRQLDTVQRTALANAGGLLIDCRNNAVIVVGIILVIQCDPAVVRPPGQGQDTPLAGAGTESGGWNVLRQLGQCVGQNLPHVQSLRTGGGSDFVAAGGAGLGRGLGGRRAGDVRGLVHLCPAGGADVPVAGRVLFPRSRIHAGVVVGVDGGLHGGQFLRSVRIREVLAAAAAVPVLQGSLLRAGGGHRLHLNQCVYIVGRCIGRHGDGVGLVLASFIHTEGAGPVALDDDLRAVGHGDIRRALIHGVANSGAHLVVLVAGRGCHDHTRRTVGNCQRVRMRILVKSGVQFTFTEGQFLHGGVTVTPAAAEIIAIGGGIHDADLISGFQSTVRNGIRAEALIGEPVVEGPHPAAHIAAIKLSQTIYVGDVIVLRAGLGVALSFQRRNDAAHHGGTFINGNPCVHQCALPEGLLPSCTEFLCVIRRKCGVLHNYMDTVPGGLRRRHAWHHAKEHREDQEQAEYPFFHMPSSSLMFDYLNPGLGVTRVPWVAPAAKLCAAGTASGAALRKRTKKPPISDNRNQRTKNADPCAKRKNQRTKYTDPRNCARSAVIYPSENSPAVE